MLVLRHSTVYNIESDADARSGTIGLYFGANGTAEWITKAGDVCATTVVAGTELETGELASVGTVPDGTLGLVGR